MSIADAAKFETKLNDTLIVAPCIEIVLHLDTTSDQDLLDFYHRTREALGERITHYQANNMTRFSKLTPRADTMFQLGLPHRPQKARSATITWL